MYICICLVVQMTADQDLNNA